MNALTLLHEDHREVAVLFEKFDDTGPRATTAKRHLVDQIIHDLSIHAAIEEQVFYPVVRAEVSGLTDQVLESLEEHHIVKWQLSELEKMSADDERFVAKVTVLKENVSHHVDEEENDLFPKVRRALSERRLSDLGDELAAAKLAVPDRPHPRLPDEPPGNVIAAVAAGVVDSAKSTAGHLVDEVTHRISDVPDRAHAVERTAKRSTKKAARKATKKATGSARTARKATKTATKRATSSARTAKKSTRKAARKATKKAAKRATGSARTAKKSTRKAARKTTKRATGTARAARKTSTKAAKEAAGTARTARRTTKQATKKTAGRTRAGATRTATTAKSATRAR